MRANGLYEERQLPDEGDAAVVGEAIRARRRALGLSLRELGERAGLSVSFLSQVERGHSSLALGSLAAIAQSLDTDVIDFLPGGRGAREAGAADARVHIVRGDEETDFAIDARVRRYKLLAGPHERTLEPMLLTIYPAETHGEALRSQDGEKFVYVIQGELAYFLRDDKHRLLPGDSIHHHAAVPHAFANDTDQVVIAVSVMTPPIL